MKYVYIVIAMMIVGCSDKSPKVEKVVESKAKVGVVQVATVEAAKVKATLAKNETPVEEVKVTKNIAPDVPSSCAMWSDGSNVCNRVSAKKASCTTNPVAQRMFSCLQWQ
jgi:hypothetical protein